MTGPVATGPVFYWHKMNDTAHLGLKLLSRVRVCRDVNHHYWHHLDGDAKDGSINIPNLEEVVRRLTGKRVEAHRVSFLAEHISSVLVR